MEEKLTGRISLIAVHASSKGRRLVSPFALARGDRLQDGVYEGNFLEFLRSLDLGFKTVAGSLVNGGC